MNFSRLLPNFFRTLVLAGILSISINQVFASETKVVKSTKDESREKLLNLFAGEWVARGLYVATKLGVADHLLAGPLQIQRLAKLTSCDPDSLQRILHMLAGFGVFEEVAQGYFANTDSSLLLCENNPNSLSALSVFYGEDMHKAFDSLLPSIQTGKTAFELEFEKPVFRFFKENPARGLLFQNAMKEKSHSVVSSALSVYDFGKFKSIYDIGGGYGQFMKAVINKYPNISGMVFELRNVTDKIHKINPHFEKEYCKISSGDFFKSVPSGAEAYILKSIVHDWDDEKSNLILKNCHKAMDKDSRLFLIETVVQPKDLSVYANCMDVLMLAVTGGKERTLEEFKQMLDKSGFVLENIHPTATEFSILEAKKK